MGTENCRHCLYKWGKFVEFVVIPGLLSGMHAHINSGGKCRSFLRGEYKTMPRLTGLINEWAETPKLKN